MTNSAYIKTWVGIPTPQSSYESAGVPRGGGWGSVTNILFSNFVVDGADSGPAINMDSGNNGSATGTSLMQVSNIVFANFTGSTSRTKTATSSVVCSEVHPCFNIVFDNVDITPANSSTIGTVSCSLTVPGGVTGLEGC